MFCNSSVYPFCRAAMLGLVLLAGCNISRLADGKWKTKTKQATLESGLAKYRDNDNDNDGHWIQLSSFEKEIYNEKEKTVCGKPFQHCCIGQGRRLDDRHGNISSLYVKWSKPLANLRSVLNYMGKNEIPCNLWFVGFSLTGDHAVAALCELMREGGYEIDPTKDCVSYANPGWAEGGAENCTCTGRHEFGGHCAIDRGLPDGQLYTLVHPHKTHTCPVVTVGHSAITQFTSTNYKKMEDKSYVQKGGVMIWNHGVHCNARNDCIANVLNDTLANFVSLQPKNKKWHIMWRETEHQHFPTVNGYHKKDWYKKFPKNQSCEPIREIDDWRNEEANEFVRRLEITAHTRIPIIPLAKPTEALYFMHSEFRRDCTHFAYSPWRFHLTWDGILRGLQMVNNETKWAVTINI